MKTAIHNIHICFINSPLLQNKGPKDSPLNLPQDGQPEVKMAKFSVLHMNFLDVETL